MVASSITQGMEAADLCELDAYYVASIWISYGIRMDRIPIV